MKFREHRGNLDASMKTVVQIEPTEKALREHLGKIRGFSDDRSDAVKIPPFVGVLTVKPYGIAEVAPLPDSRISWNATYVVLEDGNAIGFTDGPLTDVESTQTMIADLFRSARDSMSKVEENKGLSRQSLDVVNRMIAADLGNVMTELDGFDITPYDTITLVYATRMVDLNDHTEHLLAVMDFHADPDLYISVARIKYPQAVFTKLVLHKNTFYTYVSYPSYEWETNPKK